MVLSYKNDLVRAQCAVEIGAYLIISFEYARLGISLLERRESDFILSLSCIFSHIVRGYIRVYELS